MGVRKRQKTKEMKLEWETGENVSIYLKRTFWSITRLIGVTHSQRKPAGQVNGRKTPTKCRILTRHMIPIAFRIPIGARRAMQDSRLSGTPAPLARQPQIYPDDSMSTLVVSALDRTINEANSIRDGGTTDRLEDSHRNMTTHDLDY